MIIQNPDRNDEYVVRLKNRNLLALDLAESIIDNCLKSSIFSFPDNVCIYVTGSDGRLEKSCLSAIELILCNNGDRSVIEMLKSELERQLSDYSACFSANIETKNLLEDNLILYTNNPLACYPTRVLDNFFMYGNESILEELYSKFIKDLKSNGSGKILRERFGARKNNHRSFLKREDERIFDIKKGILYYDGQNRDISSTKCSHLRTVQYAFALDFCRLLRDCDISDGYRLLKDLPNNIPDRIDWCTQNSMTSLTVDEANSLKDAYILSLFWYNQSEIAFLQGKKAIYVDKRSLKQATKTIVDFATKDKIFNY